MKVLVIGGASYIGSYYVDLLKETWVEEWNENSLELKVIDNLLYQNEFIKQVPFKNIDIRDTASLVEEASKYDKVVLLSAIVGDSAAKVNVELTREINYLAVKRFCEKLPRQIKLCFISTCSVFGKNNSLLNESSPTNPLSEYAYYKLEAEKSVLERDGFITRLGTIYGLGGEYGRLRTDLFVQAMTIKAWKNKELVVTGSNQYRPIIACKDVGHLLQEWTLRDDIKPGICILSRENVNIKEIGERIAKLVPGTNIIYNDIKFEDERNYQVDNSKMLATFEYKPHRTVEMEMFHLLEFLNDGRYKNLDSILYNNGAFGQLNFK